MHVIKNYYENIVRWDLISKKKKIKSSFATPSIEKITLHMHEKFSQSPKDVYVLSLCMESLTGQRVSPRIIEKGSYKMDLVSKKARSSIHVQVTLRNKQLFNFLDTYLLSFPRTSLESNPIELLFTCKKGNISFYQSTIDLMEPIRLLSPGLLKTGPLQINIKYN